MIFKKMLQKLRKPLQMILKKVSDIFSGDVILDKGLDKYLVFVIYCFALACISIFWSLLVESKFVEIEKNEQTIEELEVCDRQRTIELISIDNRVKVEKMLEEMGSSLHEPPVQPKTIKLQ